MAIWASVRYNSLRRNMHPLAIADSCLHEWAHKHLNSTYKDRVQDEIDEERRDSSNQSARAFRRPWAPFLMLPPSHGPSPGGRGRSTTSDRETGHCVLRASATSLSSWLPQTRCGSASSGTSRSLRTPGAVLQLRSDLQRLLVGSIDKNVFFTTSSPSQSYSASLETSQTGVSA